MTRKAFYSDDDIEQAREALSLLPDLTPQRKTQKQFLDGIKDVLQALVRTKGYTVADLKKTLKSTGFDISEKALREIVRDAEKGKTGRKSRKQATILDGNLKQS